PSAGEGRIRHREHRAASSDGRLPRRRGLRRRCDQRSTRSRSSRGAATDGEAPGMSGTATKRQHFLPRLLQAGFASRSTGQQAYVWSFRREADPIDTNIVNVGTDRSFHGRGELEDKISGDEREYAKLIAELREGGFPTGSETLAAELVTHLLVRTKNFRDGL